MCVSVKSIRSGTARFTIASSLVSSHTISFNHPELLRFCLRQGTEPRAACLFQPGDRFLGSNGFFHSAVRCSVLPLLSRCYHIDIILMHAVMFIFVSLSSPDHAIFLRPALNTMWMVRHSCILGLPQLTLFIAIVVIALAMTITK